jgi:hypothetical protein
MAVQDSVKQEIRPSTGAFRPDEDGISVYRDAPLRAAGLGPSDLTTALDDLVFGLAVREVRSLDLDVRDDPCPPGIPDAEHPRNGAHALIVGFESLSTSARKSKQTGLVRAPSLRRVVG